MFITTYIKKTINTPASDFASLMQNNTVEMPIEYYKNTILVEHPNIITSTAVQKRIQKIETDIFKAWEILKPFEKTYETQYYTFKIPKRSGGLRTINAPLPEFKEALSKVKDIFEQKIKCLPHNAAYAYVKQRSALDALELHQKNKSNWYLKLDIQDFFPSCTPELIYNNLMQLYPFYYTSGMAQFALKQIIKVCCLDNGLPQGTPMSPLLTNLLMVPYDYYIQKQLIRGLNKNHFVYTRYADDILISSKSEFDWRHIQTIVGSLIGPFQIKKQKTRYGSKAGSNWNLGLMLNKDNNITLGYRKKKLLNAMLNNFFVDFIKQTPWTIEDTQALNGQLSYLRHIEPTYYAHLINKYSKRFGITYQHIFKQIINPD